MFGRKKLPTPLGGTVVEPTAPYGVVVGPGAGAATPGGWVPFAPGAHASDQVGAYASPYGAPTQMAAYYPGVQLRCGVEAIERRYQVFTASDVPYFQQTAYPVNNKRTLRDGGAPGPVFGAGLVAKILGPSRNANADAVTSFNMGLLGW